MPLTTRHVDGRRIDSTDEEQWAEVHVSGYKGLICPECTHGMYARKPSNVVRHFAHSPGYPRSCSLTAAESADHLCTKTLIAEAVRNLTGWTAEIECPGDGWRADVLATSPSGKRRIAFEPQFATIHESKARERTQRHQTSDVETVWLDARNQESLAEFSRGRLFYDERDARVGIQAFEGRCWSPRRLPLGVFIQRVCTAQLTHDGAYWASEQDRDRYARVVHAEEERRAEEARQAEARREWHRKYAAEQETRRQQEAEVQEARQERDHEYVLRRRAEQEIAKAQYKEQEQERQRKQQEAEVVRRRTEPWNFASTMSDEELLTLTKWYGDKPKPFPEWVYAGDQIHVALARRGLLRDENVKSAQSVGHAPAGPTCLQCGQGLLLARPGRVTCARCGPLRVLLPRGPGGHGGDHVDPGERP